MTDISMSPSIFRPEYRELSGEEKLAIDNIKVAAESLLSQIDLCEFQAKVERGRMAGGVATPFPMGRYFSLARTTLEESVMWAVKGGTGPV